MVAPPSRSLDPSPALRNLIDLPLRIQLPERFCERLNRLEASQGEQQPDWPAVYQEALTISEQLNGFWESRLEELHRRRLALGDPMSLRQRQQIELRREMDRARNLLRQTIGGLTGEWQSRLKRQVDYIMEESGKRLDSLELDQRVEDGDLMISLAAGWKQQHEKFLNEAMERWVGAATGSFTEALTKELQPIASSLAVIAALPNSLIPKLSPKAETVTMSVEVKRSEVVSFITALLHFMRGHVMSVSMFGGVVVVLAGLLGVGAQADPGANMVRQYLLAIAMPFSFVFGFFAIKADRQKQHRKLLEQRRQEFRSTVRADCQRLAERQRDSLERSLLKQIPDGLQRNLENWLGQHGESAIQRAEERGAESASELVLKQDKLAEEAVQLRTIRGQLTQQTAVDLRRRLRELTGGGATPSK